MAAVVERQLPVNWAGTLANSLSVIVLALLLHANYAARDESSNTAVADFGRALLDGLAPVSWVRPCVDMLVTLPVIEPTCYEPAQWMVVGCCLLP